jgi:glutaminyl-peptide cyclotransferase
MNWNFQRRRAAETFTVALFLIVSVAVRGKDSELRAILGAFAGSNQQTVPVLGVTVVKSYPHDPHAFTQGLEYLDGTLYESTGRSGQSALRQTALETGAVLKHVRLPPQYFGEGLTIFRGKIYQLTWLTKIGFIYDLRTFRQVGEFHYETEGWGLTHDHMSLILSDGTNKLQFIDPASFTITHAVEVYAGNEAVTNLNELEYINGEIFANVWHSSRIARIDPRSGQVKAWIDLTDVVGKEKHEQEDVLNGIAYDAKRGRLFVTGKDWAEIFEIKVESQPR